MKTFTYSVPATFTFDVQAETEEDGAAQAREIARQATNSDGWCAPDVAAHFPRVAVEEDAALTIEEETDK